MWTPGPRAFALSPPVATQLTQHDKNSANRHLAGAGLVVRGGAQRQVQDSSNTWCKTRDKPAATSSTITNLYYLLEKTGEQPGDAPANCQVKYTMVPFALCGWREESQMASNMCAPAPGPETHESVPGARAAAHSLHLSAGNPSKSTGFWESMAAGFIYLLKRIYERKRGKQNYQVTWDRG